MNGVEAKVPSRSRRAAVCAMLCGACVAAWWLVAMPMHRKVSEANVQLQQARASADGMERGRADMEVITTALETMPQRLEAVRTMTEISGDSTRIYDTIRKMAAERKVRIVRSEPSRGRVTSKSGEVPQGEVTGSGMQVVGGYEQIAMFIHDCETRLGATKVIEFTIQPEVDPRKRASDLVSANIEMEHLRLTWGDEVAASKKNAGPQKHATSSKPKDAHKAGESQGGK